MKAKLQFEFSNKNVTIRGDLSRIAENINKAQYQLDGNVMNSMVPYMPFVNGTFVQVTRAQSASVQGTGIVYGAYGVQGRFLYEGKTMVDPNTGSTWARRGVKKVLVSEYGGKTNARENLTYNHIGHPEAQSHWFDAAKKKDCKQWLKQVKETAGGRGS